MNFKTLEDVKTFVVTHLHISPSLLNNIIFSIFILITFSFIKRFLYKVGAQKLKNQLLAVFIKDLTPYITRMFVIGIFLKIWLIGEASLLGLFSIQTNTAENILNSLYVYLFYLITKKITLTAIAFQDFNDAKKEYTYTKYAQISLMVLSAAFLLKIWFAGGSNLSTYFGLLSAGLAIALQDVITSLAAGAYIMVVKPFGVGDRIRLGEHTGDIVDIRSFSFALQEILLRNGGDQATGRIIHIPNREIFRFPISNFNGGFNYIWHEIPVLLTFESDWRKGRKILDKIMTDIVGRSNKEAKQEIRRASRSLRINFGDLNSKVWISVQDSGVLLSMRFLCIPSKKRIITEQIWEEILNAFDKEPSIDFAYPTQRHYLNHIEGKPQAKIQYPPMPAAPNLKPKEA